MSLKGKKYQYGDKVVPISKTVGTSLSSCIAWKTAKEMGQPYLYVVGYSDIDDAYRCAEDHTLRTNLFSKDDLIPYTKKKEEAITTTLGEVMNRLSSIQNVYNQAISEINTTLNTLEEKISKINSEKSVD
jgi:hypothetical protein